MPLDYVSSRKQISARDWFGVGVRLIGVWQIVLAIEHFVTYGNMMMGFFKPAATQTSAYLTHGIADLLVGFFLLFSAMGVVNAVYPPADVIDDPESPSSGN